MNTLAPIPTEYRNIVFRSKSEAVFARTLDLVADRVLAWSYESNRDSGHLWDFTVYSVRRDLWCGNCKNHTLTDTRTILIEYKPSEPTRTYYYNLINKVAPFVLKHPVYRDAYAKHHQHTDSYLVYGNPWNNKHYQDCCYVCVPIFSPFHHEYGWGDFCLEADNGESYPYSYCHPIDKVC